MKSSYTKARAELGVLVACAGCLASVALAQSGASPAPENVMRPASATPTHFIRIGAFDLKALLPAPPPDGASLAAQADLEAVLQAQAWRTPEQIAWAKLMEKDEVFNNAAVLGAWFTAARLPATAALFSKIGEDLRALDGAAKRLFRRARPSEVDARVAPCVAVPASSSYPSGSAMQSFVWAELLAGVFRGKREELMARADRAAWGRVIGGVHFPSDLVAGRLLGKVYLAECRRDAEFQKALEASRAEMLRVAAAGR